MVYTRRRGTAIVETPDGIVLVSVDGETFTLPGGGAKPKESERDAAARELMEETGMKARSLTFLFSFMGLLHKGTRGGYFRNSHKVFLVMASGTPRPGQEITKVAYYKGSGVKLSQSAQKIIAKYRSGAWSRATSKSSPPGPAPRLSRRPPP
ncbi:MAG TPA: NUDIX domain-containing protein [Nitrososphaerales archaeon]|nr:NUDIX domain-containing protein [Nitrososphaerales archaeon]